MSPHMDRPAAPSAERPARRGVLSALAWLGHPFERPGAAFGFVTLLLAGVVALQVGLQTGGRNDDAELLLFSQTLALGYDALNPPLTVWLHWVMTQILGPTLLSTRVLVAGLLLAAYLLAWGAARQMTEDRGMATLAGLSLAGLVAWNWTPHLNLTHTVAMTTASFALLWATLRLVARPTWGAWLLTGLIAGLGLLTKYSFALVLLSVVLAGLMTPTTRRVLFSSRLWVAAAVTAVVAAPHYVWLAGHWSAFRSLVDSKLGLNAATAGDLSALTDTLALLGEHAAMVVLPALGIALLLFLPAAGRALWRPAPASPLNRARLVAAMLVPVFFLLLLAGLIAATGATEINPHHVYPAILILVPIIAWLSRGRPGPVPRGLFALVIVLLSLAVPVFLARFIERTASTCEGKCNIVLPYEAYAQGLTAAGFEGGTVVLLGRVHHLPLETLRPHLPAGSRLIRPADPQKAAFAPPYPTPRGDCLVLWPDARAPEMASDLTGPGGIPGQDAALPDDAIVGTVTGTLALSGRPAPTLGYALVKGGAGRCH